MPDDERHEDTEVELREGWRSAYEMKISRFASVTADKKRSAPI